jgi:TPR repeat protein
MNRLGELWAEGVDGQADPKEASRWFHAAAIAGYPPAQFNIGQAFANGAGVERNKITAYKWWTLAARRGEKRAERALANLSLTDPERAEIQKLRIAFDNAPEEQFRWMEDLAAMQPR